MPTRALGLITLIVGLASCHSSAFDFTPARNGPFSDGSDVQFSFNPDQDYWPVASADARSVVYAFVDPGNPSHRCMGVLPSDGGTRLWQLCDNRGIRSDTISSFAAFALDSSGRLLVAEAVSKVSPVLTPLPHVAVWIADTATPFRRTQLLMLPITVDGQQIPWISDLVWTGDSTFLALGAQFQATPHCISWQVGGQAARQCLTFDSAFSGPPSAVLHGVISHGTAILHIVSGTSNASAFSLAEAGSSIIEILDAAPQLYRLPVAGGTPQPMLKQLARRGVIFAGVSCRATRCVYASDSVAFDLAGSSHYWVAGDLVTPLGSMELHGIDITTGTDTMLLQNLNHVFYSIPILFGNGDVLLQEGGGWGKLETFATAATGNLFLSDGNSVLRLHKGLVH